MEFRLIYEGPLRPTNKGRKQATQMQMRQHKHDIRQKIHSQLAQLWLDHPNLTEWTEDAQIDGRSMSERIGDDYAAFGFRWSPLVLERMFVLCAINILMLRRDAPGKLVQSSDIDNRLKTLFDALKRPRNKQELPEGVIPTGDQDPFFVLLEDDGLISKVSVETDRLLEPVPAHMTENHYVKMLIHVRLHSAKSTLDNLHLVS